MKKPNFRILILSVSIIFSVFYSDNLVVAQSDTSHYVLPEFTIATVKLKTGVVEKAMMNYNMLTEEMIFQKSGMMLALDSISKVDTINLDGQLFVPHDKIFYEVLVIGHYSLFKQNKCNTLAAGVPSGYGGRTETGAAKSRTMLLDMGRAYKLKLPDEIHVVPDSHFWILKDGLYQKANTLRQVIKIFPAREKEIKQFVRKNRTDFLINQDVVNLVVFCNKI